MHWLSPHQQLLSSQIEAQQLPHALLITGVKHAGKRELARWLSGVIACHTPIKDRDNILQSCGHCKHCLLIKGETYPDNHLLESDKNSHKVDEIRKVTQYLQKTPQLGVYQVVTIDDAHCMNVSASNALLKTLEEPTPSSLLLLLTDQKSQLLETVISRCQSIDLKPYVGQQLAQHFNVEIDDPYLNLTHLAQLTSSETHQNYLTQQSNFINFLLGQFPLVQLASDIANQEQGYQFLQQTIATLVRESNQWQGQSNDSLYQQISHLITPSSLFSINTLLLSLVALNHQAQTNKQLQTEKFLISVQQLINNKK